MTPQLYQIDVWYDSDSDPFTLEAQGWDSVTEFVERSADNPRVKSLVVAMNFDRGEE